MTGRRAAGPALPRARTPNGRRAADPRPPRTRTPNGRRAAGPRPPRTRTTAARRAGSLVTGLLIGSAVGSLTGCVAGGGDPAPESVGSRITAPQTTGPAPVPSAGGVAGAPEPAGRAWQPVAVPATAPTPLPDPPAGATGLVARLWFRGVPVDHDGGRLVVAYAVVDLHATGQSVVGHLRLAVFSCRRRGGPNFSGCTGRRVEYGDLGPPGLALHRPGPADVELSGGFATYAYRGAVDRGPGLPARWTGRSWPLRVTCAYDPVSGRPRPEARIVLGAGPQAEQATLDRGYPNEVTG